MPDTPPPIPHPSDDNGAALIDHTPLTATLDIGEWHAILARLDWDTMHKKNVWTAYVARKIRAQINGDTGADRERALDDAQTR